MKLEFKVEETLPKDEFGCIECDEIYSVQYGNFDVVPNNTSGFSKKCTKCRVLWHRKYRKAIHIKDNIDQTVLNISRLSSRKISDEKAEFLLNVANSIAAKSKVIETNTWAILKNRGTNTNTGETVGKI